MRLRWAASLFLLVTALGAVAGEPSITREADLPRLGYRLSTSLDQLVLDGATFAAFGRLVEVNVSDALERYRIEDAALRRALLSALVEIEFLLGEYDRALQHSDEVRALQEKPADRLLSGLVMRAMTKALAAGTALNSDAYRAAVGQNIKAELDRMPFAAVENAIKGSKQHAELNSETLVLGNVRDVLQPVVDRTGELSADLATDIISARFAIVALLPLKQVLIDVYRTYLAAHRVDKPDIWKARQASLSPTAKDTPVVVAIWDSGIDTSLFTGRLLLDHGHPAMIAFDRFGNRATGELSSIPADLLTRLPEMTARLKGLSDLQSNIDSPAATAFQTYISAVGPEDYRSAVEQIGLAGNYVHGTHVAGIAIDGNPFARLLIARIEFGYGLKPDPCPSAERAAREARNTADYVDFMRRHDTRVVNMSWGSTLRDQERDLEMCGIGANPEERASLARSYFQTGRDALVAAIGHAPDLLFVAAAGNGNQDASFSESVPAAIDLPNLLVVGAVDQAGDEADFTSYGRTVAVHADGYQIDGVIPGGGHIALSGTSMAAPQVTNLAAKLFAINPRLKPADVVRLIEETADRSADGRRALIDPVKAVAAAVQAS